MVSCSLLFRPFKRLNKRIWKYDIAVQDGHIPKDGRTLIRETLTNEKMSPPLKLSFLELQANHAFIRDEMSKVSILHLLLLLMLPIYSY